MADEFSFPGLTLDENDPNSRFLDLYNRFNTQYPDIGQFLKPDDPDVLKYQELSGKPTGSEDLISNYIESMPTREEYNPSFGRKMLAVLAGTLSGSPTRAFETARSEVNRPYSEAVQEWKMEGSNIGSRARLMDAQRQRELAAMKYQLQTKAGAAKSEASQQFRSMQEARRIADEVASAEEKAKEAEERKAQRDRDFELRNDMFNFRKDMDAWRKSEHIEDDTARDEVRKARDAEKAAKDSSLEAIHKNLSLHASRQGIDTSDMTDLDVAKQLAYQKAKASNAFGDMLQQDAEGNWQLIEPKYGPDRTRILENYIKALTQKYLMGQF